jgi:eukaryotic-like serine/threonine-protein kinase
MSSRRTGGPRLDSQRERRIEALLNTMSLRSAEDCARLLEQVAAEDPELAAHISLRISNTGDGADSIPTIPLRTNVGLPDRFQVGRCLGRGGFGTVYEAYDVERCQSVAVKILREPHPDALFRFKQEFRSLAALRHPNLIEFYELFEYGDRWFFTMELVAGPSFLRHVRRGQECDFGRLRDALSDLARVLQWLHGHRLIHRDIKPDNVLIDSSGRLVLLDFGLARHLSSQQHTESISVGTPIYMAPEQISNRAPLNEATDWYAVGVVLYEALTGKPPFIGSVMEVLAAKTSVDPTPPASVSSGTPSGWSQFCMQLLSSDPASRPKAAEVLQWLGENEEPTGQSQFESDFFGRDAILRQLLDACECASAGIPVVVELTGESGFGKSRILDAFAEAAPRRYPDVFLLRGRCYENESLPFKALDALMDDLSHQLRYLAPHIDRLVPAEIGALARLFPVLERVDAIMQAMEKNPVHISNVAELRRRAFHAFASLLKAISSVRPVVICLDDLHWGDSDSAALFQHLLSRRSIPPVALVAAYRASEPPSEFIRLWRGYVAAASCPIRVTSIKVGPLDSQSADQLARSRLARDGVSDPEAASTLVAQSGGNPLLLEQLAAEFKRGQLAGGPRRRLTLAELVQGRISRLSNSTRQFLQLLAAVGEPLPEDVLVRLLPTQAEGASAVSSLVSANLVCRRNKSGFHEIEIQHSQIREAVLDSVPEPERREAHIRIAEALLASDRADLGMIAIQFARGGDTARAAQYSEKAAEAAEAVLAFNRAAQFYSMALALGEFDRAHTGVLHQRLANAHASAGRGADAAAAFLRAAEMAESIQLASALRRQAAEEWIRSGNVREGVQLLLAGSEFNIRHTDNVPLALFSIIWNRAHLAVRGMRYEEREETGVSAQDVARLEVYRALTAGLTLWSPMIATRYHVKHLRLALKLGQPRRVAPALASEAMFVAMAGERAYPRARVLLSQGLAIGARLQDPRITGGTYALDAMCGWLTGRWDLARDRGKEAERILRENCVGAWWELSVARNALLGGLLWGGQWKEYATRLAEFSEDARERNDLSSLAMYHMNRGPLSLARDDVEQADRDLLEAQRILAAAWSTRGYHIPHFFGLFCRGQVAIYSGNRSAAMDLLTRDLPGIRRSYLLRVETIALFALLLEGMLAIACAAGPATPGNDSFDLLRRARRCAEAIRRKPAIWGCGLAMMIEAGADAAQGRLDSACGRWWDAERELSRAGMHMFAAAVRYWRGNVTRDRELLAGAEDFFLSEGVVSAPRLAMMLAPGILHR